MKKELILLYIFFIIVIISACSKTPVPVQGEVTFIMGTLKINNIDAVVGGKVSTDDFLITGEKSEAVIQISETAVITLRSDTEIKFDNLMSNKDESRAVSMELTKGTTFHKVFRKGTDYRVKGPTAVASVRGTSFEVSADKSKTRINVENGTVYVNKLSGSIEGDRALASDQDSGVIILRAGESVEIGEIDKSTSNANRSKIRTAIKSKTTSNSKKAPARVAEKANSSEKHLEKTSYIPMKETVPDPEEVKALVNKKDRDLEDIKEVYSRIDSVRLYSGEVISGAIIERGDTYSIMTTSGIVKVSKKDIQSNEIIR